MVSQITNIQISSELGGCIKNSAGITKCPDDIRSDLKPVLAFLADNFGNPIYSQDIILKIQGSDKRGVTNEQDVPRIVELPYSDFLDENKASEIAHELFHAFYESKSFVNSNPDFIVEGLAVYAEYKYKYNDKDINFILKELESEMSPTIISSSRETLVYDKSFESYKDNHFAYAVSGYFFFKQNFGKDKVREILTKGEFLQEEKFSYLSKYYGFSDVTYPPDVDVADIQF